MMPIMPNVHQDARGLFVAMATVEMAKDQNNRLREAIKNLPGGLTRNRVRHSGQIGIGIASGYWVEHKQSKQSGWQPEHGPFDCVESVIGWASQSPYQRILSCNRCGRIHHKAIACPSGTDNE